MTHLLERLRPRRKFFKADILSRFGETVCLSETKTTYPAREQKKQPAIQERVWEEDHDEDAPMIRLAAAWLRRHLPVLERPCIVHADFRVGNFLFNEKDNRISAWLDWELGRIGDPHQDLAYTTSAAFGGRDTDGSFLVNGLMSEEEFFSAYERASGRRIDRKTLHWYKVYNAFFICVLTLSTGYRIARNGKTHQDVLVTWLIGIGYMLMDDMRELIEQGA